MEIFIEKAAVLIEALPFIQQFRGETVVVKFGGSIMESEDGYSRILQDIAFMECVGLRPVVVHGGGKSISRAMKDAEIQPRFVRGLRVTDEATMDVVLMVLMGKINKEIVSQLGVAGAKAIGLCGKDASLIPAEKLKSEDGFDMGVVGSITGINTKILNTLAQDEYIPVIAPIGVGSGGESYNINADTAAARIAGEKDPMPPVNVDLAGYATDKELDGLFHMIAVEEGKIRDNPLKYASNIIKKVFGALKKGLL